MSLERPNWNDFNDRHIDCNWAIVDVYCSARFSVRESIIFNIQSPKKT